MVNVVVNSPESLVGLAKTMYVHCLFWKHLCKQPSNWLQTRCTLSVYPQSIPDYRVSADNLGETPHKLRMIMLFRYIIKKKNKTKKMDILYL